MRKSKRPITYASTCDPVISEQATRHAKDKGRQTSWPVILIVFLLGSAIAFGAVNVVTVGQAHAASGLDYPVDPTYAAGGVYARFGPHTNDTQRINGYGVYPNQIVELLCGVTDGDPVGTYNNRTWHFIIDLSNPNEGNFWLNDHYIDSPTGCATSLISATI